MAWMVHDYPEPEENGERWLCPECQRPYSNSGRGGGMYVDGEIVCERCAKRLIEDTYDIADIAVALGYRWVPDAEMV